MHMLDEAVFADLYLKLLQALPVSTGKAQAHKSTVHTVQSYQSVTGAKVHDPGDLSEES